MSPATWVCGALVRDPDRSAARHRVPRRRGLLERADRTPRRRGADSHVCAGDQHPRVMFVRSRMRIRTAPSTVSSRPSNSNRSSMCRKRSFATRGQGRLPARAAVCRIPCLILCLAYAWNVCQCRAPKSPGGLNGWMASVIASLVSSARPRHPPGPQISNTSYNSRLSPRPRPLRPRSPPLPAPASTRRGHILNLRGQKEQLAARHRKVELRRHPAARLARALRLGRDLALEFRTDRNPSNTPARAVST